MEKKKVEGRKIYLDILEATMKRKNLNRGKKEAKKLKVDNVAVCCYVITDINDTAISVCNCVQ